MFNNVNFYNFNETYQQNNNLIKFNQFQPSWTSFAQSINEITTFSVGSGIQVNFENNNVYQYIVGLTSLTADQLLSYTDLGLYVKIINNQGNSTLQIYGNNGLLYSISNYTQTSFSIQVTLNLNWGIFDSNGNLLYETSQYVVRSQYQYNNIFCFVYNDYTTGISIGVNNPPSQFQLVNYNITNLVSNLTSSFLDSTYNSVIFTFNQNLNPTIINENNITIYYKQNGTTNFQILPSSEYNLIVKSNQIIITINNVQLNYIYQFYFSQLASTQNQVLNNFYINVNSNSQQNIDQEFYKLFNQNPNDNYFTYKQLPKLLDPDNFTQNNDINDFDFSFYPSTNPTQLVLFQNSKVIQQSFIDQYLSDFKNFIKLFKANNYNDINGLIKNLLKNNILIHFNKGNLNIIQTLLNLLSLTTGSNLNFVNQNPFYLQNPLLYVINSNESLDNFNKIIKKILHPAGLMYQFNKIPNFSGLWVGSVNNLNSINNLIENINITSFMDLSFNALKYCNLNIFNIPEESYYTVWNEIENQKFVNNSLYQWQAILKGIINSQDSSTSLENYYSKQGDFLEWTSLSNYNIIDWTDFKLKYNIILWDPIFHNAFNSVSTSYNRTQLYFLSLAKINSIGNTIFDDLNSTKQLTFNNSNYTANIYMDAPGNLMNMFNKFLPQITYNINQNGKQLQILYPYYNFKKVYYEVWSKNVKLFDIFSSDYSLDINFINEFDEQYQIIIRLEYDGWVKRIPIEFFNYKDPLFSNDYNMIIPYQALAYDQKNNIVNNNLEMNVFERNRIIRNGLIQYESTQIIPVNYIYNQINSPNWNISTISAGSLGNSQPIYWYQLSQYQINNWIDYSSEYEILNWNSLIPNTPSSSIAKILLEYDYKENVLLPGYNLQVLDSNNNEIFFDNNTLMQDKNFIMIDNGIIKTYSNVLINFVYQNQVLSWVNVNW